jgi:hypothetical protein
MVMPGHENLWMYVYVCVLTSQPVNWFYCMQTLQVASTSNTRVWACRSSTPAQLHLLVLANSLKHARTHAHIQVHEARLLASSEAKTFTLMFRLVD